MAIRFFTFRCLVFLFVIVYVVINLCKSEKKFSKNHSKCPSRLAISVDIGRFGNKFFEYLASTVLAEAIHRDLYITSSFARIYDRYFEGLANPVVNTSKLADECSIRKYEVVHFSHFRDLNAPPSLSSPYVQFTGHPSHLSEDVWKKIFHRRDELIQRFRWRSELIFAVEENMGKLKKYSGASTVIGIHARMTDYYQYVVPNYGSFAPASATYFNKAMNHFRANYRNAVFLVISNDVNWCKENLEGSDVFYPGDGNEEDPGWDLAILASCDHLILTYGTYGLMAAWLKGGGTVIAADNFTNQPEVKVERMKSLELPNWKWMSV